LPFEKGPEEVEKYVNYLEERISYLEEVNRFTLDALEMAASLGNFQTSINKLQEPSVILNETCAKVQSLIQFKTLGFFMVDETDNDFYLALCEPKECRDQLHEELDVLIEDGTFAWALRQNRAVILSSNNQHQKNVLHVMATNSRVRGMFLGFLDKDKANISDVSLSLLSIIMLNSANALESFELYKMIREINEDLEKKENYHMLFEAAPDGVEVVDPRGNVIECNRTHELLLGYEREKIIGHHTTAYFSEKDKAAFEEKFQALQEKGQAEGEIELVRKDGVTVQVWRKERAIHGDNNEFLGSVIYNRDISDLKLAEKEKMDLQAELQRAEKMKAIGTLAGGVAHDLNNVLAGLVSYPELLLTDLQEDSPLRKPILTIQKSGQKAAAIVQDLLTLARRGVPVKEVVNLNQIISEYLTSPEFEKLKEFHPHVTFRTDLSEGLSNMKGSPIHLSKVIMNMISNGAEAMPEGGEILIKTENRYLDSPVRGFEQIPKGEYTLVTIADAGIGMSPEDMEKMFEPFYTKKVMGRSGTGLGTAVVWGTVKDHQGYIDIQSCEGQGTTFVLYFPVTREALPKEASAVSMKHYMGNGESILVVDDIQEQRELASKILSSLGYSVTSVNSGEDAVAFMEEKSADLLILDMIMDPGIDGLETYKRILEIRPAQKAIIASGFSETDRVKEAQKLGAGPYIRKPYVLEEIGLAIRDELRKP
jgi:PAS domain S-box-containing protein